MLWEIASVAKHLVLPPLGFGWLLVLAWLLLRARPRMARWLVFIAVSLTTLCAMPLTAQYLSLAIEISEQPMLPGNAQAIVVLAAGRRIHYGPDGRRIGASPAAFTLERMRAGMQLARGAGLPLLVTGGKPDGEDPTEGEVMRDVFSRDYGIKVRWVEDASRNTAESADYTARMLRRDGIHTVVLVTHAFHMRRSLTLFRQTGLRILPAPVLPVNRPHPPEWADFLPNMQSLARSHYAMHEMGGMVYALLRTPAPIAAVAAASPSAPVGN